MGHYITNTVRAKIDKCAYAMAKMEIGEYEFPDGKPKYSRTPEGIKTYRVVKTEAQRYGWGPDKPLGNKTTTDLFNEKGQYHDLLMKRLAYHRQRLAGGYSKELAELTDDGEGLRHLSKKLFDSLMEDLNDPDRAKEISFKDRAALYRDVTKLEAHVKGDASTSGPQPVINATNVIGTLNLPDSVRDKVQAQIEALEGEAVEDAEE